jgi:hypothetical protein
MDTDEQRTHHAACGYFDAGRSADITDEGQKQAKHARDIPRDLEFTCKKTAHTYMGDLMYAFGESSVHK